jgi:hypothetical protein
MPEAQVILFLGKIKKARHGGVSGQRRMRLYFRSIPLEVFIRPSACEPGCLSKAHVKTNQPELLATTELHAKEISLTALRVIASL